MKSHSSRPLLLLILLSLFAMECPAVLPSDHSDLSDFDHRAGNAAASVQARQTPVAELQSQVPGVRVDFDEVAGSPKWIRSPEGYLSGPDGEGKGISAAMAAGFAANDPHRAVKAFIEEHQALFGHGPEALSAARIYREYVTPHNEVQTTLWQQELDGIEVYGGVFAAHTTKAGELIGIASQFIADPATAAATGSQPVITAEQAVVNAAVSLEEPVGLADVEPAGADPTGQDQRQQFAAGPFNQAIETRLVWLPMNPSLMRLCWEVTLTSRARGEAFRLLVDAETGEVQVRRCLTVYLSEATYRVYTSDSPSPFSPGWSTPSSIQPALTSRGLVTWSALDTNASPNGWIDDGVNETRGNNVDAHTDRDANNSPDLPRPQGSPFRVFDYPMDLAQSPATYTNAAVVQLFYWCNFMHDKLYELGFTEAAGNYQNNNFGRGGLGNDAVQADAQDGSGYNNANFTPTSDGTPPRIQMYLFNGVTPNRDGDFDADVVLHEYTHGLSERLVGGGVGISSLQTGGMGEGWSDWYALSVLSEAGDDVNGCYAAGGYVTYLLSGMTQNYYFGIRRYPYSTDLTKNPLTFKDIDPAQASSHAGIPRSSIIGTTANEVHNMGEVWCVTLWEARANLIAKYGWAVGNQKMMQLATDGMKLGPANPNFIQARDGILLADQVDNGGANRGELWAAFAKRGMGFTATSPVSSTTTGLHESFEVPDDLQITPVVLSAGGPVGGPFTPNPVSFILTNTGSNTITWTLSNTSAWVTVSPASGSLAAGGPGTGVAVTVLPTATNLPLGAYNSVIQFTNQTSGLVQTRTFSLFIVGRSLFDDFDPGIDLSQWSSFGGTVGSTVVATNYGGYISSPNSLWFGDAGSRFATTVPINTSSGGVISFYICLANGSAWPWEQADYLPDEGVVLESSIDSGVTWNLLGSYDTTAYYTWTAVTLAIPTAAQAPGTQFRWRQKSHSGASYDHWALDNVSIDAGPTPPSIQTQPQSQTVSVGSAATFNVSASGSSPLSYAWWRDGALIPGANGASYTTNNVQLSDSGSQFTCLVSNTFGVATSQVATLTVVAVPPAIAAQPLSRTIPIGSSVSFSVTATGSTPLSYYWQRNGALISGANASTYTTNNVQLADSGAWFSCLVSNAYGTMLSSNAVLTVVTGSVDVITFDELPDTSSAPVPSAYHNLNWSNFSYMNGVTHAGPSGYNAGVVSVSNLVYNAYGTPAGISSPTPFSLVSAWLTAAWNDNLQVEARGYIGTTLAYDNFYTLSATSPTLINFGYAGVTEVDFISSGGTAHPGYNGGGTHFAMDNLTVIVGPVAPTITMPPASQTVQVGGSATFSVEAFGSAPLSYFWMRNGTPIAGANASSYTTNNVQLSDSGSQFSCLVSNAYGTVLSSNAMLTVNLPPPCTPSPSGLVGWWPGEGNANDIVGTNNGLLINGTYTNGVVQQAFSLSGANSYVSISNSPSLDSFTSNITVEVWLKSGQLGNNPDWASIVAKGNSSWRLQGTVFAKTAAFSATGGTKTDLYGTQNINDGQWHHLAGVYDGTNMFLYVDGTLDASQPATGLIDQNSDPLCIGANSGAWDSSCGCVRLAYFFNGLIDEVSLYNRALSAAEIKAIYDAGSAGKCSIPAPPVIITQPASQTAIQGESVTFSVTTGSTTLPLSYQWFFNGTNISGATNTALTLTNVQPSQAGNYAVLVTNVFGYILSSNAVLTVVIPPAITTQPAGLTVPVNGTATFSVTASGTEPLAYSWRRNGTLIPGANGASYSLTNAQLSDSGSKFSCLVTNAYGTALSSNALLKVIEIVVSNDLCSGATLIPATPYTVFYTNAQSTAKATSTGDPVPDCVTDFGNGVWYQFTAPNSGLMTVDTFGSDFDTGLAVYAGTCGSLVELDCNDDTDGFTSEISLPVTGGTTYYILAGGYSAYAGNLVLHLAYATPPVILDQPANQSVIRSNNVTLMVVAGGTLPLSYQWYDNGVALADDLRITGSATSSLTISNVATSDTGTYTVAVSNLLGSASSTGTVLTVVVPAAITLQPSGRSVVLGQPASFTAAASGTPLNYQWQLNDVNIPGATNTTYSISAARTNDFGVYHLAVSNAAGTVVSADAVLTWGQIAAWGRNDFGQTVVPPGLSNVVMVAGGGAGGTAGHTLALRADGTVIAWGFSGAQTNVPTAATNIVAIAAGGAHSLALRANGTVLGWGSSLGSFVPAGLSNVIAIAAGSQHSLALRSDGKVLAWGYNGSGQTSVPTIPIEVVAIGAGANHSLAVCSDGTVAAWGMGFDGQTNVPFNATNMIAVAGALQNSLALRANGTVLSWGTNKISLTNAIAGLTNATGIGAGDSYYVGLRANGTVLAWGSNDFGQTNVPAYVNQAVAVAGGASHALALISDGRPIITRQPVGGTSWVGRNFTLLATVTGTAPLACQWQFNGADIPGATNVTLVLSNLALTNAGIYRLVVSNALGTVACIPVPLTVLGNSTLSFGNLPMAQTNYQGNKIQLGASVLGSGPLRYQWFFSTTNKNYTTIAGATNNTMTLDPALAVQSGNYYIAVSNLIGGITSPPVNIMIQFARAWGFQAVSNPPVNVTNAIAIAAGGYNNYYGHYFALGADGKLTSWANYTVYYGETNVSALSNSFVTAIAAGYETSLALRSDGTIYVWGYGAYGQTNPPAGLNNVVAVACGDYHNLALKSDGTIIAWGQNNYGEATNSLAATNAAVAIAAGTYHNLGLRADGTVFGWGYANYGQLTIPAAATNVIAIAAGQYHSLALRADGTAIGWGNNSYGQTTIPAGLSNIVAISASSSHSTLLRADGTVVTLGYEYTGYASNMVPADLVNVSAITSGGDHDFGLLGTRAPAFTIQPLSRTVFKGATNVLLAAKVVGVQPVAYQWRFNGTNIAGATNDMLKLTNLQFVQAGAYQLIASNAYGVVLSKPAKLTVIIPLGEALDATNRVWTTSGNASWYGQTNVTHDGVDAARTGDIGNSQETILQTVLVTNWSGHCTFWWKVSSEDYFDVLEFRLNGVTQTAISGEVDWQPCSIAIPAGTNTLQWRYSKDASYGSGQDAGWVDQFSFNVDPPVITLQPVGQTVNLGTNVQFQVIATGATPLTYQWRQNSTSPVGGNNSLLILNSVGRSRNGAYSVMVTNVGGSVTSSIAMLKVLVPQKLGTPVLLPDGTLQLTSGDADGGLLSGSDLSNFDAWASTNLIDWVSLSGALSVTNGTLRLQDGTTASSPQRFYRIIEKP